MKKNMPAAFCFATLTAAACFGLQLPTSSGHVGDLKYSFLELERFQELHGKEWVLCDGKTALPESFKNLTGISKMPDGRGVFIRAMHNQRADGKGDPETSRVVGSYQADIFKSHSHSYADGYGFEGGNDGSRIHAGTSSHRDHGRTTGGAGGAETRPRNICAHLYVKVR